MEVDEEDKASEASQGDDFSGSGSEYVPDSGEETSESQESVSEEKEQKAGTSSIQKPATEKKLPRFVCVEYPGIVKNPQKMMETLGGIEEISRTFENDKKRLQLKYRPDNIYAKPAYGDRQNSSGLLMKIRVTKPADPNIPRQIISQEMVGIVDTKYTFNTMCDYQFLPVHKNDRTGETECIYEDIVPQGLVNSKWLTEKTDVPFFLPPTVFSRTDTVQQRLLKNEVQDDEEAMDNFVKVKRKNRSKYGKIVQFSMTDPVPTKPNKAAPDILKSTLIPQEQYDQVYQLFQQRPIWTRRALLSELDIDERRLSSILTTIAYFYLTGPWRTCCVRFGYDPRKNFESRYYQILDYRVRQSGGFKNSVKAKRDQSLKKISTAKVSKPEDSGSAELKDIQRVKNHIFDVNTVPSARVVFYQFCDVHIPKIQEMLYKIPTPLSGATCNEKRGWLPPHFIDQCRNIMSEIAQKNLKNEFSKKLDQNFVDDDATEATFEDYDSGDSVGFPDLEDDDIEEGESSKMEVD